jgi:putative iron-only hydrogenase system regulator
MIFILTKENALMETRVAVLAIIVRGGSSVQPLNELLHQYGQYIIGRMGVPYREKGVNIISVALDAPGNVISLSGKIGRLDGITAKTVYAPEGSIGKEENQ